MGADLSELSPRGDEEYVDPFSTENRLGVVVEPDTGDDSILGHWFLDLIFGWLSMIFWSWPLLPFIIAYWIFFK